MKVSVVIPVYNVAPYVERCLASVFQQTYDDIEIIIVDDCSTDSSMEIVRKVVTAYSGRFTIRIMVHSCNLGLSAARNTGIKAAKGTYLYFLDSDDAITADCISLLATPLSEYPGLDLVIGNYRVIATNRPFDIMSLPQGYLSGNESIFRSFLKNEWYCMACNKLVCRKFINDNALFFKEGLLHEDTLWSFFLAGVANTIYVVKERTYLYYVRKNSITGSFAKRNLEHYSLIISEIEQWSVSHGLQGDPSIYKYIEAFKCITFIKGAEIGCLSSLYPLYQKYRERKVLPLNAPLKRNLKFLCWEFQYSLPIWLGYRYTLLIFYAYNCKRHLLNRFMDNPKTT